MDINRTKTAGVLDMVVVSIDPAADIDYLRAALQINPIEINFTEVLDGEFSYYCMYPKGVKVSLLKNGQHNSQMPDINSEPYLRCLLDRQADTGLRLVLTKVNDTTIGRFRQFPLVFKPHRDIGVLTAAPKEWRIIKSEEDESPLVTEPCFVPEEILSFLEFLKLPIPDDIMAIQLHRKRLELRLRFVEWYVKRFIARDVRQFLNARIAELTDAMFACDLGILNGTKSQVSFPDLFVAAFSEEISKYMPADIVAPAIDAAFQTAKSRTEKEREVLSLVSRPKFAIDKISPLSLEMFFRDLSGTAGFAEGIELLLNEDYEKMPIHQCVECGSFSSMKMDSVAGTKSYFVQCKTCISKPGSRLTRPSPLEAALAWNRKNPSKNPVKAVRQIMKGRFSEMPIAEVAKFEKRVREFLSLVAKRIKQQHDDFGTHESLKLSYRYSVLSLWIQYLHELLKESHISGSP